MNCKKPRGIIFSGGTSSVYQENAPTVNPSIYELGVPILGICYGIQLMARQLGGQVSGAVQREYGRIELRTTGRDELLCCLGPVESCWMSHGDRVDAAPRGFVVTARTEMAPVAAMSYPERKLYAVQFHPEVVLPVNPRPLLSGNDVLNVLNS
jgi:GMP synthase (glutamine-hydrolysing)